MPRNHIDEPHLGRFQNRAPADTLQGVILPVALDHAGGAKAYFISISIAETALEVIMDAHALKQIQEMVMAGLVAFTEHAFSEMRDEVASMEEVLFALENADSCDLSKTENDRWLVSHAPTSLTVVVAIRETVVVVTVFGRS